MGKVLAISLVALAFGWTNAIADDISDEFKDGLPKHWKTCQMYAPDRAALTPDDFDDPGDKLMRITVDKASLGGRKCEEPLAFATEAAMIAAEEEAVESLGPSVVDPLETRWEPRKARRDPYCMNEVLKRTSKKEGCLQREEMRLATSKTGDPRDIRYYSMRFRMPYKAPDTVHSIRWILTQWKMEPTEYTDPSPFLALRYDDGILHVTVQNQNCRCLVASAKLAANHHYPWVPGPAKYCVITKPGPDEGKKCDKSGIEVTYGDNPHLLSPVGRWIEMQFQVQAGSNATIKIRQNGKLIATVTGDIGYKLKPGEPTTKFKMGHYRDYIPSTDVLDIDWVKVSQTKPWKD